MNELVATYLPIATLMIGVLALAVSVIVEVIKNIPLLKSIPTDLVVLVLALVLTLVVFFAYRSCAGVAITWYYVVGAVIAGFFVAFVTMYGWTKLTELYSRFKQ